MEVKQLKGGVVIAPETEEERPTMRLGSPGTLFCDEATGVMLIECAQQQFGIRIVTQVRVIFREVEGIIYMVVSPVWTERPAAGEAKAITQGAPVMPAVKLPGVVYDLKNVPKHPTVYQMGRLVNALKQPLRRDFWYVMESQIVNDEQLGLSVAGDFTHAVLEPREVRTKKNSGSKNDSGSQSSAQSADKVQTKTTAEESNGPKAS